MNWKSVFCGFFYISPTPNGYKAWLGGWRMFFLGATAAPPVKVTVK
jgi:hypothetical protein